MRAIVQRDRSLTPKAVLSNVTLTWLASHPPLYTGEPLTCIPAGVYNLVGHQGLRKKDVWEVADVLGHTGILIHEGNFPCATMFNGAMHAPDSENCFLVGQGLDATIPMVLRSIPALEYLRHIFGVKPQGAPMNITLDVRD